MIDKQEVIQLAPTAPTSKTPKGNTLKSIWNRSWPYITAILSLILIWEVATLFLPSFVLPQVNVALAKFFQNFSDAKYLNGLGTSLMRLALGYPIACLLGALLGLLAGLSRHFAVYLRSLIAILQSIPPITWVPFLALMLGFGNAPIIIVITIASFFPMALSVMNATEGINKIHLELGRVLGASKWQLLTKIFAPESLPAVVTGAQVSFGNAWRSLIAAEMVGGASSGLGWTISYAGETANMAQVLASIMTIGGIALILDHIVLERIKHKLLHWRYVSGGE
ncbi:MAG TPA: ABC transporter permease [Bacillota bacterium]|nr:ABC transporter permease [Bacillota bacterium]